MADRDQGLEIKTEDVIPYGVGYFKDPLKGFLQVTLTCRERGNLLT